MVEAFTQWVFVSSGRCWWWAAWRDGCRAGLDTSPTGISEHHGTRRARCQVGVAGDAQLVAVVHAVMGRAETDQVPGVGVTVIGAVDDVVHLHPSGLGAAGDAAAEVAVFDEAPCAVRHDRLGTADVDRIPSMT